MTYVGHVWECECGYIEYMEDAPEECPKCHRIDSFVRLPEELVEERKEYEFDDGFN